MKDLGQLSTDPERKDAPAGPTASAQSHEAADAAPAGEPPVQRVAPWRPGATLAGSSDAPATDGHNRTETSDLPVVAPGADLGATRLRPYWPILCFVATFLVYLLFVPRILLYSSPPTGDQVYYMLDTISLVQDHDLLLNNNYEQQDWQRFYRDVPRPPGYVGMQAPNPLSPMLANATARPPTEQYAFHVPGLAVLMIPAWVIGGAFGLWWPACIVFMCLLGALVSVNIFLFAHELTGKVWIAWLAWLPVAFSGPLMSYSYLIFTELPVGLLLIYVFRRLALGWAANGPLRLLLIGLMIGTIPWLAWRCVLIAAALGLYALVQYIRYRRASRTGTDGLADTKQPQALPQSASILGFVLLLLPVLILGGLLLAYNLYLFGRVIPDSSVLEQGRVAIFHYPWKGGPDFTLFVTAIFGQLLDRGFGLLPYAPVYILAVVGIIAMFRLGGSYKRLLLWMGLIAIPYLGVISSFDNWNGVWCPPARYMTTFVPFMAGMLAVSLYAFSRSIVYKVIYALLTLPGIGLMLVMLDDPRLFWPLDQGGAFIKLSQYEWNPIKTDLSLFLPIFSPVDDTRQPVNTGWMLVAAVAIVLFCYLLMQIQTKMRRSTRFARAPYPAQGAYWAVSLLAIGLGWFVMNEQFLKHRTEVVQINRWELNPHLEEAYGITYFRNKIYISSYARNTIGTLGVFDPASGKYELIQPRVPDGSLAFFHIGDVKPGPDGKLYVLNNAPGDGALLVMSPDGQIEKGLTLDVKTPIATGLNFGPQGNIYISDMLGGRILKYPPSGGSPLGVFAGMTTGFNNPSGVAVTPDGTIYAAEQGYERLQKLAPDGKFIRNIDLRCKPAHIVVSGDFLDVACDNGLISVNWRKDDVQLAHYDLPDHRPVSPTGLTYGPDNNLYVLQGSSLIEYKITH